MKASQLHRSRLLALALAGGALVGCATYTDKTERLRDSVARGDLGGGLTAANKLLKVDAADELPDDMKGDRPLVVLERGSILHALGRFLESAKNLQAAEGELELLDLSNDAGGKIAKYIWSDSATKYKTPPVERLALNALNMINYLAVGDLNGARVEAKRFTTMRNYLRDYDPEHAYGGFGSYLAGFTMEKLGETDSALLYYDEALEERSLVSLVPTIKRMWRPESFESERFESLLGVELTPRTEVTRPEVNETEPKGGELLVVVNVGRVPRKKAQRIPIGAAIGLAGTYVTGDPAVLERTALKVFIYPELVPAGNTYDSAAVQIDGHEMHTELVSDIAAHVVREYTELKPKIIGAGISRMITRALVAEGARAAGSSGNNESSGVIGALAALAVEGAMVAADKPDTRSWTLLPAQVYIARQYLPAGDHEVQATISGPGGEERRVANVTITEGGFSVVDFTTLR